MSFLIDPYRFNSFTDLYSNNYDGTNEYAIGNIHADLQITGAQPFFASVWLKADAVGAARYSFFHIGRNVGGAINGIWAYINNNRIFFTMVGGGRQLEIRTTGGPIASTGVWYHVVIVKNDQAAANSDVYVNGSVVAKTVVTNTLLAGDTPVYERLIIARNSPNAVTTDWYDGRLYHHIFGNLALNSTQVTELNTLKGGDARTLSFAANVKAAFRFPNGQSDYPTVTEYVNGNNLTMTNQESTDIDADIP